MPPPTFDEDVSFMQSFAPLYVLHAPGGSRVAVSPTWQGRVMTSAFAPDASSLGFVNRVFLDARRTGTQFDNYGGEDRFWVGPEAGQHGLYFPPKALFSLETWQVPHALQEGTWSVDLSGDRTIALSRTMTLTTHSGVDFHLAVTREVNVLSAGEVEERVGAAPPETSRWVAFETVNRIRNAGPRAWTRAGGLPSIWILGQYPASADSFVIVPFEPGPESTLVNDRYFGPVPADRLLVRPKDGYLAFKTDGKHRSKIGVGPRRAKPTAAGYSRDAGLLTLVRFTLPTAGDYVNSMWELQSDPYDGDALHSYNDGPVGPGRQPLGSFYEIETSSPGAELAPGQSIEHRHATLHISDAPPALDLVAERALGIRLSSLALPG